MWQAFFVSTGVVALGEIGDKTQLLALLLAARFRKPVPIILGILVATLANHAGASALGNWITRTHRPAVAALGPGRVLPGGGGVDADPGQGRRGQGRGTGRFGVFGITTVAFFLAEMGDKTQIATVMLAAKFDSLWVVTAGTTLGMMIANVPAVLLGDRVMDWLPVKWVHRIAAAVFARAGGAGAGRRGRLSSAARSREE